MSFLTKIFEINPKEYDKWQINWAPEDPWLISITLGLIIPCALWFFWTSLRRIGSKPKKVFLLFLRIMTFAFLLIVLLRPELEFKKNHSLRNYIAVLLDNSKSLSIKTFPKEISRVDFIKNTLEFNKKYLEQLNSKFIVDTYFVSDEIQKTNLNLRNYQSNRPFTDFSGVLEELGSNYENKSLQGVLLFSDGADLTEGPKEISEGILKSLTKINAPVYAFQAGNNDQFKDLAVESVSVSDFGFVQQPVHL